jgi:glycosyltransferase involved in cell wall biosynthesis
MVIVSAVIPTRGRPELLRRAVRTALAQTLRELEVVVVIDGVDPATHLVVEELARQDPRVRQITLSSSVGGSDARNRGVDAAVGEWITMTNGFRVSSRPSSTRSSRRYPRL